MEQYTVPADERAFVYFVAAECVARGTVNTCNCLGARDMFEKRLLTTRAGRHKDDGEPARVGRSGTHPFQLILDVDRSQHRRNRRVHHYPDIGHADCRHSDTYWS